MSDLDELLWKSGGDGSKVSADDWKRILDHLFAKLESFFGTPLARIEEDYGNGFFVAFESATEGALAPLCLQIRGTCGVDFPGAQYPCVQGFVYLYREGKRIVAATGANHVYIRYQRIGAAEKVWDMSLLAGPSEWYSFGWSADEFGEFEGDETWIQY